MYNLSISANSVGDLINQLQTFINSYGSDEQVAGLPLRAPSEQDSEHNTEQTRFTDDSPKAGTRKRRTKEEIEADKVLKEEAAKPVTLGTEPAKAAPGAEVDEIKDYSEVKAAVLSLGRKSKQAALDVLAKFKVSNAVEIEPHQWMEFVKAIKAKEIEVDNAAIA